MIDVTAVSRLLLFDDTNKIKLCDRCFSAEHDWTVFQKLFKKQFTVFNVITSNIPSV